MPGGLLDGRGCYDSLKRCENESHLFLSIRNHGTPFVVEQQKVLVDPATIEASSEASIEESVRARFAAGAMPLLRVTVKFVFMATVFPFNFCFCRLPLLAHDKVLTPLGIWLHQSYLKVRNPVVAICGKIYNPLITFCTKSKERIARVIAPLQEALTSRKKFARRVVLHWHATATAPAKHVRRKIRAAAVGFAQKYIRWGKIAKAWTKVLIDYGFSVAQGKKADK